MSNYFEQFPSVNYRFGNDERAVKFQHLGTYIDILDQVKQYDVYYENYAIQNGERPDALSYSLYKTPNHYWTFWLLNDHIRQQGWPLRDAEVWPQAQKYYPNKCFTTTGVTHEKELKLIEFDDKVLIEWIPIDTKTPLCKSKTFKVGNWVWFKYSRTVGKILRIDQELGMLHIDMVGDYKKLDDVVETTDEEEAQKVILDPKYIPQKRFEEIVIDTAYDQFDAPHHYEDVEGNWIYPSYSSEYPYLMDQRSVTTQNSVSYYQRLAELNEEQKVISVIKKGSIDTIVNEFRALLNN